MDFTSLVQELGIDKLPEEKQKPIFESIFRTLSMRVSLRIAHELTDEQRKQLEEVAVTGDKDAMQALEQVYPDFRKVYQEEVDNLKDDIQTLL